MSGNLKSSRRRAAPSTGPRRTESAASSRSTTSAAKNAQGRTRRVPAKVPKLSGEPCPSCGKPAEVCVCDRSELVTTRLRVVVLQHPQEQDVELGSAKLLTTNLRKAKIIVGLSWRSLSHALGEDVDPERWAVIFPRKEGAQGKGTRVVDKRGVVVKPSKIDGIVVLDGTWSQAKTLWWRNPWFLKLQRVVLEPREASIYGAVRKEPRREYVSTLESIADTLVGLGESEEVRSHLRRVFRTMVQRARDAYAKAASAGRPPRTRASRSSSAPSAETTDEHPLPDPDHA
jgi:DTW domain-containing protein YfiP